MFNQHQTLAGTPVFVSEHATKEEVRFPDKRSTKRRRRRVIGKYGSWKKHVPCAFRAGPALYVHPTIYAELKRQSHGNSSPKI